MTDRVEDERVTFYLRHQELIETWAGCVPTPRKQQPSSTCRWLRTWQKKPTASKETPRYGPGEEFGETWGCTGRHGGKTTPR